MDRLLTYLPATLHLVLCCRTDPPLLLSRLRAEEQIVELRDKQLRLSVPETVPREDHTLTEQQDALQRRLTEHHVTDEQIRGMWQFAQEISLGIDAIEDDFEARRHIVDTLDVQVTLGHDDDGDKAVYASCTIGPPELCIVYVDTRCHLSQI